MDRHAGRGRDTRPRRLRSGRAGFRADLAIWDLRGVQSAGNWDPAALLLAGRMQVRDLFVEGRQVVRDGHLTTLDLPTVLEETTAA